ncbi:transposase [Streptomyces sp. NPDC052043]|uniref:transposase n=1 Tax=Streptomyces sp. NPDC052043 TaxID=3365684 RepID=UPI0037D928F0
MLGGGCWVVVLRARPGRDEGEQAVVHRLASARKAPKVVVERCRMVELSWGGWLVPQIADELRCSQKTVRRWLHRFNRCGLEGLEDLGGQGRMRRITEAERSRIVGLVKLTPPGRLEVQPSNEMWAADESGLIREQCPPTSRGAEPATPRRPRPTRHALVTPGPAREYRPEVERLAETAMHLYEGTPPWLPAASSPPSMMPCLASSTATSN